jgi:hypothetical protein
MSRLPVPGGDNNVWGGVLNDFLSQAHNADGSLKSNVIGSANVGDGALPQAKVQDLSADLAAKVAKDALVINVLDHGVVGDGVTDDAAAINAVIAASPAGSVVFFPAGNYVIGATVYLKPNRTYRGTGRNSRLVQKASTQLTYMVDILGTEAYPRTDIVMEDLYLDGNRANNTNYNGVFTDNNGLRLYGVLNSTLQRVSLRHFGTDGLVLDGSASDYNHTTATCHFLDVWAYDNGRYGVNLQANSQDNHFELCDLGYNDYENILLVSGSNTFTGCAIWQSKNANGALVGASGNLFRSCQIEGNAQHGVSVTAYSNHTSIIGCKIYANGDSARSYDGIYVNGSAAHPARETTIIGNSFYSEMLFGGAGPGILPRHAVTLDTYASNSIISGNQLWAIGQDGELTNTVLPVYGLKAGDVMDGVRWVTAAAKPSYAQPAERIYVTDTGNYEVWSYYRTRWERELTGGYSTDGGDVTVSSGSNSVAVVFGADRFDTAYTPHVAPAWQTVWWISARASTGFTVSFGTPPVGDSTIYWSLIRH